MFTSKGESEFFLGRLKPTDRVLEYGSGASTREIASLVKEVVSIEHQEAWFNSFQSECPDNCTVLLRKPDLPYKEGGHCGTYEEFKSYVDAPMEHGPFDVVLIDGRARVACASVCHFFAKDGAAIFVHDFDRGEYAPILEMLDKVD